MNPVLETSGLTKRFDRIAALDDLTLSLPAGHIVGLLGRNGCGKTTLLQHAVGLLLPSAGECRTLGTSTRTLGAEQLARMGYVPQAPRLIEWMRVEQHLSYLASFYVTWDLTRQERLQAELELPRDVKVGTLSGGDLQKFAVIASVCHHPKLLFLDEPFSALDPIVRERMLALLIELAREDESTIVVSSHILHDVEKVIDWVVCLDRGRLVVNSALDELQERYAEWTIRVREGSLPVRFPEPFVLTQEGDANQARLRVVDAAGRDAEFGACYHADVTARPLNLEQIFPLLVGQNSLRP